MVVSNIFYFHPYLERWSNLTNIFQVGWNHQLEIHVPRPISFWYPFIKFLGCTILGFYSFFAGDFWSGDSTTGWIYRTWKVDHFLLVQMLFSCQCVFSNHPTISGGCIKNLNNEAIGWVKSWQPEFFEMCNPRKGEGKWEIYTLEN